MDLDFDSAIPGWVLFVVCILLFPADTWMVSTPVRDEEEVRDQWAETRRLISVKPVSSRDNQEQRE
jgi:hypothetical protein